jgi:hypothetical protein
MSVTAVLILLPYLEGTLIKERGEQVFGCRTFLFSCPLESESYVETGNASCRRCRNRRTDGSLSNPIAA